MRITKSTEALLSHLKKPKKGLLAGSLVFAAGASVASIGAAKLIKALSIWASNRFILGAAFDDMMAASLAGLTLILPILIFVIIGYLIIESHSLGAKLSFPLSTGLLVLGVLTLEAPLILSGILCLLAVGIVLLGRQKENVKNRDSPTTTEKVAKIGLRISAFAGVSILIAVIVYIIVRGMNYITWDFITGGNWEFSGLKGLISGTSSMGISAFIIGSFLVVGLSEAIAIPLGLGAAIYMAEYANENRITSTLRFFIETLAGAPSIVIALFGFYLLVYGLGWYQSWLPASLCLSFMILPWNIRVAEESMKVVPYSYREGSYALGATKWQTVRGVVLLTAFPGIITGLILGFGAALGETTVLYLVADSGNTALPPGLPLIGPGRGMPTLPILIYRTYFYDISGGATDYSWQQTNVAFAAAFVLLAIFLVISFAALVARNYVSKKTRCG
jgi:phosphate transport system permease protein